jgi:hypothetical protein
MEIGANWQFIIKRFVISRFNCILFYSKSKRTNLSLENDIISIQGEYIKNNENHEKFISKSISRFCPHPTCNGEGNNNGGKWHFAYVQNLRVLSPSLRKFCNYFIFNRKNSCPKYKEMDKACGLCPYCLKDNIHKYVTGENGFISHMRQTHPHLYSSWEQFKIVSE